MNFASDNVSGVAPAILEAIIAANQGSQPSYGADEATARLEVKLAALFEHEVAVFPVATGTAANALALAALTPPWGAVICHQEAHIAVDEANAPEFFTGGAKLLTVPGADGKLTLDRIVGPIARGQGDVHHPQPAVLSLTQATEAGTIYQPAEVAALAEAAHLHGLTVHMDGARFANAVASLDVAPSEVTWRAGVDVLSFGATKNGALAAEAVIFFDPARARELGFRRKRGGHLFSKMRFLSAQLDAYVTDDLWLRNARHANRLAAILAEGLAGIPGIRLRHKVEANEIFVEMPEAVIAGLEAADFVFYRWDGHCIRLVTHFDTNEAAVTALLTKAAALAAG
jgi:threonine aldolase